MPQEENETYRLVLLFRLSWELPKYSNLRVKGVCIGEQFVRMSWRVTRVLSGTFEPKSKRSSSGWPGHCVLLTALPHVMGTTLSATLAPVSHPGWGGGVALKPASYGLPRHGVPDLRPNLLANPQCQRSTPIAQMPSGVRMAWFQVSGPHVGKPTEDPLPSPACFTVCTDTPHSVEWKGWFVQRQRGL